MKKHVTIPIFLPKYGCKNNCVFCDQKSISGQQNNPSIEETELIIKRNLETANRAYCDIEIAFFGGNFLGLDSNIRSKYLDVAQKYIDKGEVDSIRLSTQPDSITESILKSLNPYQVKTIEIGLQSTDYKVLIASGRKHFPKTLFNAVELIKKYGYRLGAQMMAGLPEDTKEKCYKTASDIVSLNANEVRIYPVIVFRNSILGNMYKQGTYKPLTIDETVEWLVPVVSLFNENDVNIIKLGLHPLKHEIMNTEYLAGPIHPSIYQLINTEIWYNRIVEKINVTIAKDVIIIVHQSNVNNIFGYYSKNKKRLEERGVRFKVKFDNSLDKNNLTVIFSE